MGEAALPPPPEVSGPAALKLRLQAYADAAGRLTAVRAGSWDARAKRVIDTASALASPEGKKMLEATEKRQAEALAGLEKELVKLKSEDKIDDVVKERCQWAQDTAKREFLSWCQRLLKQKETLLLKAAEGQEAPASGSIGAMAVLQNL